MFATFFTPSETHLGPCQTSMMELFRENSERQTELFSQKSSVVDVWQGLKYAFSPSNK